MKKVAIYFLIIAGVSSVVSCGSSEDKKATEPAKDIAIDKLMEHYDPKDSNIIKAYAYDKTTISINDIDPKDTSFSTRSKVLYRSGADTVGFAVVYGYKRDMSPGIAVFQRGTEEPVRLKQTNSGSSLDADYSNGDLKLQRSGKFAFLNGVQYEEIQ